MIIITFIKSKIPFIMGDKGGSAIVLTFRFFIFESTLSGPKCGGDTHTYIFKFFFVFFGFLNLK